jgi:hypothetical protein
MSPGELSLGGTLEISLINGFTSSAGQTLDILNWGSLAGAFSAVELPPLERLDWNTSQLAAGMLSVVLPGDFNGDGTVSGADLNNWKAGFDALPASPMPWARSMLAETSANWGDDFGGLQESFPIRRWAGRALRGAIPHIRQ